MEDSSARLLAASRDASVKLRESVAKHLAVEAIFMRYLPFELVAFSFGLNCPFCQDDVTAVGYAGSAFL